MDDFKISLICIDDAITNIGIRRIVSFMRSAGHYVQTIYMPPVNIRSLKYRINPYQLTKYSTKTVENLKESIRDSQIIGFSVVSYYTERVKFLIERIRKDFPDKIIIVGGAHATIVPNDAIQYADIICRGEGEYPLLELVEALKAGRDYTKIRNLWIHEKGKIIKNTMRPLLSDEELDRLPYPDYYFKDNAILINEQIVPMGKKHYLEHCGVIYATVFTMGCPMSCSYCANNSLAKLDPIYKRIRKPSVVHLIDELVNVKLIHPYIKKVQFLDDSFLSLSIELLKQFADQYKKRVEIPFLVGGVSPINTNREKIELLINAGMTEVRMGIQSGNEKILKLFNRKTPTSMIIEASKVFAEFKGKIIPPAYDFIIDNPYEATEDLRDTILLLDKLNPPFTLNIFSLQYFPNTAITLMAEKDGLRNYYKQETGKNREYRGTYPNLIISLYGILHIPSRILKKLLNSKKMNSDKIYPWILTIMIKLRFAKRAIYHILYRDFSILPAKLAIWAYKMLGRI